MDKELVKTAFREAEESRKQQSVDEVKKIVQRTLEKLESLKADKDKASENVKDIEEKIKLLKLDIEDLKEGRLDRFTERQEKDPKAKETSVVIIIKETKVEHNYPFWYWPYNVIWNDPPWYPPQVTYTTPTITYGTGVYTCNNTIGVSGDVSICGSSAKWGTCGSYQLTSGNTVNLR